MQKNHPELVVMVATATSNENEDKLKGCLGQVGTDLPLLYGMTDDELEAWQTKGFADARLVRGGKVVSKDYKDAAKLLQ